MLKYIGRRLLIMIPTTLLISLIVFFIIQLPPGDYISTYISQLTASGEVVDQQIIDDLRQQYGLDQPFIVQYGKWIWNIVTRLDFGYSFSYQRPVAELIGMRIGLTIMVSLVTMIFTYLVAIPIGVYSAVHQYSIGDYIFSIFGFIGMAIPGFLFALILMYLSYVWFNDPLLGLISSQLENAPWSMAKVIDLLKHLVIPIIVIGLGHTCSLFRTMRAQMLDEINRPYTLTARAKGLSETRIRYKYCFRAAINPMVSSIGWSLVSIFTGSTITAIVLNLPIQGPMLYKALMSQDMYLAGGWLFLMSILTVIGTLISDILLAWLDPRIRYTSRGV